MTYNFSDAFYGDEVEIFAVGGKVAFNAINNKRCKGGTKKRLSRIALLSPYSAKTMIEVLTKLVSEAEYQESQIKEKLLNDKN
jgi:hypothetical protein